MTGLCALAAVTPLAVAFARSREPRNIAHPGPLRTVALFEGWDASRTMVLVDLKTKESVVIPGLSAPSGAVATPSTQVNWFAFDPSGNISAIYGNNLVRYDVVTHRRHVIASLGHGILVGKIWAMPIGGSGRLLCIGKHSGLYILQRRKKPRLILAHVYIADFGSPDSVVAMELNGTIVEVNIRSRKLRKLTSSHTPDETYIGCIGRLTAVLTQYTLTVCSPMRSSVVRLPRTPAVFGVMSDNYF